MIKKKLLILLSIASVLSTITHAELVYEDGRWQINGGVLERYFNNEIDATTAIDAMNKARAQQELCNNKEALEYYKIVYTCYPDSVLAPEALYQTGQIRVERSQFSEAFQAYKQIITNYPSYPKFDDVIAAQFEIASLLQEGKRPYYWGVIPGLRNHEKNIEFFESIVTNAPYNYYAPFALMNIADLSIERKKTADAIDALERIINDYPESSVAPDAFLKLGDVYMSMVQGPEYDQGATIEAMHHYEDFVFFYPEHEKICIAEEKLANARDTLARSNLVMGDFYYKYRNNLRAARTFYNQTITTAPTSPAAQTAEHQLDLIDHNILAKKTVVDLIFGRYQRPNTPAYLQGAEIEAQEAREFYLEPLEEEFNETPDSPLLNATDTVSTLESENEPNFLQEQEDEVATQSTESIENNEDSEQELEVQSDEEDLEAENDGEIIPEEEVKEESNNDLVSMHHQENSHKAPIRAN